MFVSKTDSMHVEALFFDIDGTLVSFQTHQIPESTQYAIRTLREKGIKVFIATGRALCDINNLGDLAFDGFITANGAYCLDSKGHTISENLISRNDLDALTRYLEADPFPCAFMTDRGNFINFVDDSVHALHELVNIPAPPAKPLAEILKNRIYQMDAFIDEKREAELLNEILTSCTSNRWHPAFTDINAQHTHKAAGMDHLLAFYGLDLANTMAFGDGGNDIRMLKHAGVGIAMGNADDAVKKAADYVTDSVDEDGILNALKKWDIL